MKCRALALSEFASSYAAQSGNQADSAQAIQRPTGKAASSAYGCKSSNLIPEPLGLDDCNLLCNSLVGVKVKC